MTPEDICLAALKRIGAIDGGAVAGPPDQMGTAFLRLNALIDLLATQKLTINGLQKFSMNGIAGHNPYTIGPAGDFNQARPVWLPIVTITIPGSFPADLPVDLVDVNTYAEAITTKTVQSSVPTIAYYDQAGPPRGNLFLWPILNSITTLLNIWVPVALTQFAALNSAITLLPGYQAMLEYNLAADLIAEWGRPMDATAQLVMQKAAETLGWIKRANFAPPVLGCDPGMLNSNYVAGGGNWFSGP